MRLVLLSFLMLILQLNTGQAQTIPNNDFENWDTLDYEDLKSNFWITGNRYWAPEYGLSVVDKVSGYLSANAIRLEVKAIGTDTLSPVIANEIEGLTDTTGGKPYYDGLPTAFTGFYRHSLLNNDTALLVMILKKNGLVLSADTIRFTGNQPAFTQFNRPLSLSDKPDTIITFAAIGNVFENEPGTPGSWLELDSFTFTISGAPLLLPDGNFERWVMHDYDVPEDWEVQNEAYPGLVVRTRDAQSGNFALQLSTLVDSFSMDTVSAEVESDFIPLTSAVSTDSLIFYYKFTSPATAFATMEIQYYSSSNTPVGTREILVLGGSSTVYNRVARSLDSRPSTTASFKIFLTPSSFLSGEVPGSSFFIDNLMILRFDNVKDVPAFVYKVFPNPARDVLNITTKDVLDYSIKDITGKTLLSGNTQTGKIDISEIPSGTHLLILSDKDGVRQNLKFNKQ